MKEFDEKGDVICQLCGKAFNMIVATHLKKEHNTTMKEYKEIFPNVPVSSLSFRANKRFKNVEIFKDESKENEFDLDKIPEVKIDEFNLDKIPTVDSKTSKEAKNFLEDVKNFSKEYKVSEFPDPTNSIQRHKLKILNFLISYFPDVRNSYFIEKHSLSGMMEYRLVTDICIPSIKVDLEFPKTFWHNIDLPKFNRDERLKKREYVLV